MISNIYANRVFDSKGVADPDVEIKFGPNIKDWPEMSALPENLILKVVSEIHDPVTTTDELIPSGETSSYRSNPLGLAEFALSRKDPAYVGRAKEVQKAQKAIEAGNCPGRSPARAEAGDFETITAEYPEVRQGKHWRGQHHLRSEAGRRLRQRAGGLLPEGAGRLGQYRQRVRHQAIPLQPDQLGNASASSRKRIDQALSFKNGDYLFVPEIRKAVEEKAS